MKICWLGVGMLSLFTSACNPLTQNYPVVATCQGQSPASYYEIKLDDRMSYGPHSDGSKVEARNLDLKKIVETYNKEELECWSLRGDPISAFALVAKSYDAYTLREIEYRISSPMKDSDISLLNMAASPRPCINLNAQKALFFSCQDGLPEAQYILGVAYINNKIIVNADSVGRYWLERSRQQQYSPAEERINTLNNESR